MGWRPPRVAVSAPGVQPFSEEPIFGDERDAYADLMQRDLALRQDLDQEAKRRATTSSLKLGASGIADHEGSPSWAGGGRFASPQPPSHSRALPVSATGADLFGPVIGRSGGGRGGMVAAYIALATTLITLMTRMPTTREEWEALQRKREAIEFAYRRLTHQMAAQFSREEMDRIKAESGVDFDIVDQGLSAPTTEPAPEEGRQAEQVAGIDWIAAIRPWIPFISRDVPEDEDYCFRRWQAEQRRCGKWRQDWARRGCLERARNRYMLCFGNGGMPNPNEPDEWSEADMERWYNPDR